MVLLEGQVEHLHETIRAASLDGDLWSEVMAEVHTLFPAACLQLLRQDLAHCIVTAPLTLGYDPWHIERFNRYYGTMNPWAGGFLNRPLGTVLSCDEMAPYEEVIRTEFWADYIGPPQGNLTAGGGLVFSAGPDQLFGFGANFRKRDQEALEPIFLRFVEHIRPTMAHAFEVNRMMAGLRLEAHVLRHGVDPHGSAVLVLSRDHSLIWCNPEAVETLRSGDHLTRSAMGHISVSTATGQAALRRAASLGQASARLQGRTGRSADLRIIRMGEEARDTLPLVHIPQGATPLLVLLLRPQRERRSLVDLLAEQHGLTPAEAAVALALSEGARLEEIAETRGASVHTVRNQVKALRLKMGARTQGDVVRQVGALRRTPL